MAKIVISSIWGTFTRKGHNRNLSRITFIAYRHLLRIVWMSINHLNLHKSQKTILLFRIVSFLIFDILFKMNGLNNSL